MKQLHALKKYFLFYERQFKVVYFHMWCLYITRKKIDLIRVYSSKNQNLILTFSDFLICTTLSSQSLGIIEKHHVF